MSIRDELMLNFANTLELIRPADEFFKERSELSAGYDDVRSGLDILSYNIHKFPLHRTRHSVPNDEVEYNAYFQCNYVMLMNFYEGDAIDRANFWYNEFTQEFINASPFFNNNISILDFEIINDNRAVFQGYNNTMFHEQATLEVSCSSVVANNKTLKTIQLYNLHTIVDTLDN